MKNLKINKSSHNKEAKIKRLILVAFGAILALIWITNAAVPSVISIDTTNAERIGRVNVTLSVETDENSTCRYAIWDTLYSNLTNAMDSNDGFAHTHTISYTETTIGMYYVRCADLNGTNMSSSSTIKFNATVVQESDLPDVKANILTDEEFKQGIEITLSEGDRVEFETAGQTRFLRLTEVSRNNTIKIIMWSKPVTFILKEGNSAQTDFDEDSIDDVRVTVKDIGSGSATLEIKKLPEEIEVLPELPVVNETNETEDTINETITETTIPEGETEKIVEESTGFFTLARAFLALGIIIFVGIIISIIIIAIQNKKKRRENLSTSIEKARTELPKDFKQ